MFDQLIISEPFNGRAESFIKDGKVLYSNLTIEEYLQSKPNLKVISWDEFDRLHADFFTSKFQEITKEAWTDALECLPPLKWHTYKGVNIFYNMEANSGDSKVQL
jgi:hypothetical protein